MRFGGWLQSLLRGLLGKALGLNWPRCAGTRTEEELTLWSSSSTAEASWAISTEAAERAFSDLAFLAARDAVSLDQLCAGLPLHGATFSRAGGFEDAYYCMKEAGRRGGLNEAANKLLEAIEDHPDLDSEALLVYRDLISGESYPRVEHPRRILVFTNLPPQEMGGYGRSIWELCEGLICMVTRSGS